MFIFIAEMLYHNNNWCYQSDFYLTSFAEQCSLNISFDSTVAVFFDAILCKMHKSKKRADERPINAKITFQDNL